MGEVDEAMSLYTLTMHVMGYTAAFLCCFFALSSPLAPVYGDTSAPHNAPLVKKFKKQVAPYKIEDEERLVEKRMRESMALKVVSVINALSVSLIPGQVLFFDKTWSKYLRAALRFDSSVFSAENGNLEAFAYGSIYWTEKLVPVILGFFVFELLLINRWMSPGIKRNIDMVGHHFLSILFFPLSIIFQTGQYFLLIWMFYEISSPFLSLKGYFQVKHGINSPHYSINGICFMIVFFFARLGTVPAVLFMLSQMRPLFSDPVVAVLTTLGCVPCLLNVVWGVKIGQIFVMLLNKKLSGERIDEAKMTKKVL